MEEMRGEDLAVFIGNETVAPSEEAQPTLGPWTEFEPMRLETPRTPKHAWFHCTKQMHPVRNKAYLQLTKKLRIRPDQNKLVNNQHTRIGTRSGGSDHIGKV
ncbi:hypothetical protein E2C01_029693 [Portunus trituberculatus]|uniref:Uncharacterized protein n=1 Tax=Portunus trituberculatus TaxID=210409 RepID=A0A5B7ETL5_PORTR|nr:hypothetical protein [Portunus trituberculatus]